MRISDLKARALDSLKGNWGLAIGLTLVYFLISVVLVSIGEIILSGGFQNWSDPENVSLSADVFNIVVSILLIPFYIGVYWFFLNLVRGEQPTIQSIFSLYKDGNSSVKMIITSILQLIFTFLWALLFLIPGMIKSLSYSQAFYILKDHPELSALEAITESRKRMDGLKWKYFLLSLSFIGWGILATLSLGIGFLWLIPYMSTTLAAFYDEHIADKKLL